MISALTIFLFTNLDNCMENEQFIGANFCQSALEVL